MNLAERLRSVQLRAPVFDGARLVRWRDELVACAPSPVRHWLLRRDRRLLVAISGATRAELSLASGDDRQRLGPLELNGKGELPPLIGVDRGPERQRTVVSLPADFVLRRTVTLPSQVRENLPQVMRYEIDRLSPFSADQVYFAYTPHGAGRSDRLTVELAICRRDKVQPWLDRLRELGRPVDQLTWDGAWPRANLLAPEDRPSRRVTLFTLPRAAGLLTLVLLIAAMGSPVWQREQILERIAQDLRAARAEAIEVDDVRQSLERAREGSFAVLRQKVEQPRISELVRELSEQLPDDTWIQSLEVRDGEVQIRGESARATALIEVLESAPGFDGVGFRSPVTQVAQTGKERFHIAFRYDPPSTQ
ncbi:Tfp pilus assembly protein PilN [Thioflavicoccus mobilis 8321]|uniref:Tfp pilus assembly protein PilN n=1 Tax=Thioflavicoccus mobilis 8321 TaxID=765912 RepID=L0GQ91_9GAMM|nr:PilN domain-containing protein [Thioflavicoccus mobilis]AGA88928.1 Tfp pilus assembly protein PilN [Thioflavicoccus mobilis 8321]